MSHPEGRRKSGRSGSTGRSTANVLRVLPAASRTRIDHLHSTQTARDHPIRVNGARLTNVPHRLRESSVKNTVTDGAVFSVSVFP